MKYAKYLSLIFSLLLSMNCVHAITVDDVTQAIVTGPVNKQLLAQCDTHLLSQVDKRGWSPLVMSVQKQKLDWVQALVEDHKVPVGGARPFDGLGLASLAEQFEDKNIYYYLLKMCSMQERMRVVMTNVRYQLEEAYRHGIIVDQEGRELKFVLEPFTSDYGNGYQLQIRPGTPQDKMLDQ